MDPYTAWPNATGESATRQTTVSSSFTCVMSLITHSPKGHCVLSLVRRKCFAKTAEYRIDRKLPGRDRISNLSFACLGTQTCLFLDRTGSYSLRVQCVNEFCILFPWRIPQIDMTFIFYRISLLLVRPIYARQ